jgi:hypothetical protein
MPGSYVLVALAAGKETLWALENIDVSGVNLTGIALGLQPAQSISGRVVLDVESPRELGAVRVGAVAAGATILSANIAQTPVRPDGSFVLTGFVPGTYNFTIVLPSISWTLRTAMLGGADVADRGFQIEPGGNRADAVLTLTDRSAEVSGALLDAAGVPVSALSVVVFPADKTLWAAGTRRTRSVHPATDGRYRVADLPAGDYFVAALTDVGPDDLNDPSFFEGLLPASVKVTLGEGEKRMFDLRMARGPE